MSISNFVLLHTLDKIQQYVILHHHPDSGDLFFKKRIKRCGAY